MKSTQLEYRVIFWAGVALVLLYIPAFLHARAEVRDNLRKEDLANVKRALEQYFNRHNFYVGSPGVDQICTRSNDSTSWFFGNTASLLRERFIDALPHDIRENDTRFYRYCVTSAGQPTPGYFLEARLEVQEPEGVRFDDDEERKFHYRILQEDGHTLYRVCGGTESQCDPS